MPLTLAAGCARQGTGRTECGDGRVLKWAVAVVAVRSDQSIGVSPTVAASYRLGLAPIDLVRIGTLLDLRDVS